MYNAHRPSGTAPKVHLWIYNHSFYGISDQIEYFLQAFRQHGYAATVGREPSDSALNVVIENFSVRTRQPLIDFCTRTRKRVAVIMTEHIDFIERSIFIHGDPLWSDNDYMHPVTQAERLKCLMSCQPYIKFFMVLGDLPELRNFGSMMVGADVRAIPFPRIDRTPRGDTLGTPQPPNDLLFTGYVTAYREKILPKVAALGLSIASPRKFVSRRERDRLNRAARIVLNVPQREKWRWLSLMRVIAALRCGRATVSLGTNDTSRIAACTYQLSLENSDWKDALRTYVAEWTAAFDKMYARYCLLADDFEREYPFPHDVMEYWAITDRV
jgi:hypothetical protein